MKSRYIGLCGALWLGLMAGCIYLPQDTAQSDPCDKARRCDGGGGAVCGVDGKTYACAELATCENVAVDDTGDACRAVMCEPLVACNDFCTNGRVKDANGCEICQCACQDISKPDCAFNESRVCVDEDNDSCDDVCLCVNDDTGCADLAPIFCPGDSSAVCVDTNADGCDDDCSCSQGCPDVAPTSCPPDQEFFCAGIGMNGCETDCACYELPDACDSDLDCELTQVCEPDDVDGGLDGCVELKTCAMNDVICGEPLDMLSCEQPEREDCCNELDFECEPVLPECPYLCFPLDF